MQKKLSIIYLVVLVCVSPLWAATLITGLTASGQDCRIDLTWQPVTVSGFQGYNIYRSRYVNGTYAKLNSSIHTVSVYSDFFGDNVRAYWYYVKPVISGVEGEVSSKVTATPYEMTDDQLLTSIQQATFRYFWDFGHPVSGLARERFNPADRQTVTTGGSGFGLMTIIVGVERGFVTRAQAAQRVLTELTFLQDTAQRFHGAWSHWMDGTTGAPIAADFDSNSNPIIASDVIETADMIVGILTCRQYFDSNDPTENEIRSRATQLYEGVEWDWYRRASGTDGKRLWWSWSPAYGWEKSFSFGGCESMNAYLLAIASPTHPIPASCYYDGFGFEGGYKNGERYYNYIQWVSPYSTPMFWTHYSFLGFDPRKKNDNYCNYFENSRNIALIDRAYCIANPKGFSGYSDLVWGLTSSYSPWGYIAHSPGATDNGTIAPTAAISSMPYTPAESIATLRHFYFTYGSQLWGPLGFYDAFNLQQDPNWFSNDYLAIDQGPITVMIENYRTGLCWNLFMSNPEISQMLTSIGWATRADNGLNYKYYQGTWTVLPDFNSLTPISQGKANNFDIGLRQQDANFAFKFTGFLDVASNGGYTFYLKSDDGSKLSVVGDYGTLVIDNDGTHTSLEKSGYIYLLAGRHPITVTYFQSTGLRDLLVSYSSSGTTKRQIPVNKLFRCSASLPGDFSGDCQVDINDLEILAANWLNGFNFADFSTMAADWME
jgi:hypothetical protein